MTYYYYYDRFRIVMYQILRILLYSPIARVLLHLFSL